MKIKSMRWGYDGGGIACGPVGGSLVAEVVFEDEGKEIAVATTVFESFEHIWVMKRSIFQELIDQDWDVDELSEEAIEEYDLELYEDDCAEQFKDSKYADGISFTRFCMQRFCDISANMPGYPGDDEAQAFIRDYVGKDTSELDIPFSDYRSYLGDWDEDEHGDDDDDAIPEAQEDIYKERMGYEAELSRDHVNHDIDADAVIVMRKRLAKLIAACDSEEAYADWRADYIAKIQAENPDKKYLTCAYIFAGIGQYEETIPEEMLPSFKCWINGNGSAFYCGEREATVSEVERCIALGYVHK